MNIPIIVEKLSNVRSTLRENLETRGIPTTESAGLTKLADSVGRIPLATYTGHLDENGLKAIGWDDADIKYARHFVNWMAEDDNDHIVKSELITDYLAYTAGTMTMADYIAKNKTIMRFAPKFNTAGVTSFGSSSSNGLFNGCVALWGVPKYNTSSLKTCVGTFVDCYALTWAPDWDLSNVTSMANMFQDCDKLEWVPDYDCSKCTTFNRTFYTCRALIRTPNLKIVAGTSFQSMFESCRTLTTIKIGLPNIATSVASMAKHCYSVETIYPIDFLKVDPWGLNDIFTNCYNLRNILGISNLGAKNKAGNYTLPLGNCSKLTHDSAMVVINGLASGMTGTDIIQFHTNVYQQLTTAERKIATDKGWTLVEVTA